MSAATAALEAWTNVNERVASLNEALMPRAFDASGKINPLVARDYVLALTPLVAEGWSLIAQHRGVLNTPERRDEVGKLEVFLAGLRPHVDAAGAPARAAFTDLLAQAHETARLVWNGSPWFDKDDRAAAQEALAKLNTQLARAQRYDLDNLDRNGDVATLERMATNMTAAIAGVGRAADVMAAIEKSFTTVAEVARGSASEVAS